MSNFTHFPLGSRPSNSHSYAGARAPAATFNASNPLRPHASQTPSLSSISSDRTANLSELKNLAQSGVTGRTIYSSHLPLSSMRDENGMADFLETWRSNSANVVLDSLEAKANAMELDDQWDQSESGDTEMDVERSLSQLAGFTTADPSSPITTTQPKELLFRSNVEHNPLFGSTTSSLPLRPRVKKSKHQDQPLYPNGIPPSILQLPQQEIRRGDRDRSARHHRQAPPTSPPRASRLGHNQITSPGSSRPNLRTATLKSLGPESFERNKWLRCILAYPGAKKGVWRPTLGKNIPEGEYFVAVESDDEDSEDEVQIGAHSGKNRTPAKRNAYEYDEHERRIALLHPTNGEPLFRSLVEEWEYYVKTDGFDGNLENYVAMRVMEAEGADRKGRLEVFGFLYD